MNKNILVIDDEEGIRYTFEYFLSRAGYSVSTAQNFTEALSLIHERDFDVIFSDIILGDKTGIDILGEVRKKNRYSPFIIITGQPHVDTAAEAVRLGAFDYIAKPVQQKKLLDVTQLALEFKKVIDEREEYRLSIEAISRSVKDAIITLDSELSILELNEAAHTICGLSRDSVGRNFQEIQTACHAGCLRTVKKTIESQETIEDFKTECRSDEHPGQVVTITSTPLINHYGVFFRCGYGCQRRNPPPRS